MTSKNMQPLAEEMVTLCNCRGQCLKKRCKFLKVENCVFYHKSEKCMYEYLMYDKYLYLISTNYFVLANLTPKFMVISP